MLISAAQYDALLAAARRPPEGPPTPRNADEFCSLYQEWVDAENERFERIGIWNQEFRTW